MTEPTESRGVAIARSSASPVVLLANGHVVIAADGRTQDPESARTTKFALRMRSNEDGEAVVTFGPYHIARVRSLSVELPDPGGGTFILVDLR